MLRKSVIAPVGILPALLAIWMPAYAEQNDVNDSRPDRTIVYKTAGDLKLSLHVFDANTEQTEAPHPALLLFHGGAWQFGGPEKFYRQCQYFSHLGLTCISAQYRIRSVHGTNPAAAVQDARAAFRYLYQHAAELNIDTAKIAVGGGSAGGHLAAALGVAIPLPPDPQDAPTVPRPKALVLYNPVLDLSSCCPKYHLVVDAWRDISPLQHIDGQVPPTLILQGTDDRDVSMATAIRFCDSVTNLHGRCELALYEGAKHGFFNDEIDGGQYFNATNGRVVAFLARQGLLQRRHDAAATGH